MFSKDIIKFLLLTQMPFYICFYISHSIVFIPFSVKDLLNLKTQYNIKSYIRSFRFYSEQNFINLKCKIMVNLMVKHLIGLHQQIPSLFIFYAPETIKFTLLFNGISCSPKCITSVFLVAPKNNIIILII